MAEELKPCPFCGSKRVRIVSVGIKYERDYYWRVKCDNCYAYGPYMMVSNLNSREAAEAKWNTRVELEELCAENHRLREALEVIVGKIRTEDEMIDIAETALASTEAALSVCRCPECAEPERHVLGVGFISSITQSVGAVNIKLRERSLPVPLPLPVWDISRYRIVLEKEDNDGN